jgi:hypothetical protein
MPDAKPEPELPRRIKNPESVLSLSLFCTLGQSVQPKGLIHYFPRKQFTC